MQRRYWDGVAARHSRSLRAEVRTRADLLADAGKAAVEDRRGAALGESAAQRALGHYEELASAIEKMTKDATTAIDRSDSSQQGDPPSQEASVHRNEVLEYAWSRLNAALVILMNLVPDEQVEGWVPEILAIVKVALPIDDPRRTAIEHRWSDGGSGICVSDRIVTAVADHANRTAQAARAAADHAGALADKIGAGSAPDPSAAAAAARETHAAAAAAETAANAAATGSGVTRADRRRLTTALQAAFAASAASRDVLGRFRRTLFRTVGGLLVVVATFTLVAALAPKSMHTCLVPGPECTPRGGDVPMIELFGLIGAALAAARSLSGLSTATPHFSLPVVQALLKLELGAITAVIGTLFLSAGLEQGVVRLTTPEQVLGFAVVFGYAQQALTGQIDRQASTLASAASQTSGVGGSVGGPSSTP